MNKAFLISLMMICLLAYSCKQNGQAELVGEDGRFQYPEVKRDSSAKTNYFGKLVYDPYRWLEAESSKEVEEWVEEQNDFTNSYLATLENRPKIQERLTALWDYEKFSAPFKVGEYYFFYKNDGLQNQSVLYKQKGLGGTPEVFLDPNTFSKDGTVALKGVYPSNDDKYLAYGVSESGSDWQKLYVMEVESGVKMQDEIEWVKFSGAAWEKDGFYYGRYPEPEKGKELSSQNFYKKIYYHKLGSTQAEDVLIYEDTEHPTRGSYASTTDDEQYLLIYQTEGATNNNSLIVKDLTKNRDRFRPIVTNFEHSYDVVDNLDGKLLVKTNKGAPNGRLVLINPRNPKESRWDEIIPEKELVLGSVEFTGGKIFANYKKDVSTRIHVFEPDGTFQYEVELPGLGQAWGFGGDKDAETTFYSFTSFLYPTTIYEYNIKENKSSVFQQADIDINFDDYTTVQKFIRSKDGSRVPIFITHKKGIQLDGSNPCLLYAYGGFNISILPSFSISRMVFLENGGIYVSANLRGGSEYGEKWHEAGMAFKKQNVFDDFIAAAEYLVKEGYTSNEKLAISGRSNGGLLVGAVMAQRPELYKVALPGVGVMDMLRYHKFSAGYGWIVEYGCADSTEKEFKNLYGYSPLHNLKEGTNYPATLVTTADHDDRVVPAHSYKFISELQHAHEGENPVLIRIDTKAGHGAGKSTEQKIEEATDVWGFVFHHLGIEM